MFAQTLSSPGLSTQARLKVLYILLEKEISRALHPFLSPRRLDQGRGLYFFEHASHSCDKPLRVFARNGAGTLQRCYDGLNEIVCELDFENFF
jgi:hypothetical protein